MTEQDFIVTPLYFLIIVGIALIVRPSVSNQSTRSFFLPALILKLGGAILLGLLYQFWYGGGDTFNYFTNGSKWIYEAFLSDFSSGVSLLLEEGGARKSQTFEYSQHIWYYRDPNSYYIVRITGFFDLFTLHTYSATALFFAVFSFSGSWALYWAVQKRYPWCDPWLAVSVLFVPTVIFWGSGILKDSITLGALGWLTWSFFRLIELQKRDMLTWLVMIFSAWLIFKIKIYILICFIPTSILWVYWRQVARYRSSMLKILIAPVLIVVFITVGFLSVRQVSSYSSKYSLDSIAQRAAITANDIRYGWGARTAGDGGYDLGVLDGSWSSMITLMPAAINVSLFRPYLWEVRNPLMLLASLEATIILILTIWFLVYKKGLVNVLRDPFLVFCLSFALLFAFAVGVSTYNFGTLMRYKIPFIPFYLLLLTISSQPNKMYLRVKNDD